MYKTMNDTHFPEYVNLYPVMAIQAARRASRVGGGYRLYVLAKALDRAGRGSVSREDLREYALSLGVSPRQWVRWIDEARKNDLVQDVQRANKEWELILPSAGAAAFALSCQTVGRRASMKAADLIGYGWKARIWAAYDATHNGRPVSREWMQKNLNVPVSTQRYRDVQAGVTRQQNHVKLNVKVRRDELQMWKDHSHHKGVYIRKDGYLGTRKPDARFTDLAERGRKGRTRKANKTLHRMQHNNGLSLMRQALSNDVTPGFVTNDKSVYIRLFYYTPAQVQKTLRRLDRQDRRAPHDIFQFDHTAPSGSAVFVQA